MNAYRKVILLVVLSTAILSATPLAGRAGDGPAALWTPRDATVLREGGEESYWASHNGEMAYLEVDLDVLRETLANAPLKNTPEADEPVVIDVPLPDGSLMAFEVVESPVMVPEMQAEFPELRTYAGRGVVDRRFTVRLDQTPLGFHAQIFSPLGTILVDPPSFDDPFHVISYYKPEAARPDDPFECLADQLDLPEVTGGDEDLRASPTGPADAYIFRIAIGASVAFVRTHGGTFSSANATINTILHRVNQIYIVDAGVELVRANGSGNLIYVDANDDPYTRPPYPTTIGLLAARNNAHLIAEHNAERLGDYELGIVFTVGYGNSGIAKRAGCCNESVKGWAAVSHGVKYDDDPEIWAVDYVAHEIGHMFNAGHTWNGVHGACTYDQWTADSAYEPGSGSTVMSYAGNCRNKRGEQGDDNLPGQHKADDYFHWRSHQDIREHAKRSTDGGCGTHFVSSNNAPVIPEQRRTRYTIPKFTPFGLALDPPATDPDGDPLKYCWEETDKGKQCPLDQFDDDSKGDFPLFRSYPPKDTDERYFPALKWLINPVPPAQKLEEKLPRRGRTLTFQLTVRDGNVVTGGGGVATVKKEVVVSGAGPAFNLTKPRAGEKLNGQINVRWDVADTQGEPFNVSGVRILLSTDGGLTFPTVLLETTPNDGSEDVTLPDIRATRARIMIEAIDNIFFNISRGDFEIYTGTGACCVPGGTCAYLTEQECDAESGVFGGVDSECVDQAPQVDQLVDPFTGPCLLWNLTSNEYVQSFQADFEDAERYVIHDIEGVENAEERPQVTLFRTIRNYGSYAVELRFSWDQPGLEYMNGTALALRNDEGDLLARVGILDFWDSRGPREWAYIDRVGSFQGEDLGLRGEAVARLEVVDCGDGTRRVNATLNGKTLLTGTVGSLAASLELHVQRHRSVDDYPFSRVAFEHLTFGPFEGSCGCIRDPQWVCDGDVDGNGIVNPVDVGLVQSAFGSSEEGELCSYDLDCNGQINPVDAGIVQSLFGRCDAPRDACP